MAAPATGTTYAGAAARTSQHERTSEAGLLRGAGARGAGLAVAALVTAAVALASLLVGREVLSPADVYAAYADFTGSDTDLIVTHLRVPRTLAGVGVGVALGVAGAVVQGVTRNPLGGPGILGVNVGASLAAVLAITFLGVTAVNGYVWFAFVGAAVATVVVYGVASLGSDGVTPVKLALAGAAMSALLGSVTSAVILRDRTSLDEYRFWSVGSLAGAESQMLAQALPFAAVGLVMAVALVRQLNALALGDELAQALGLRLWLVRLLGGVTVVLLAGTATAAAGPIGFLGLAVPHAARALAGPDYRWIVPWTAVLSPALLLTADIVGRVAVRPEELQVGIVMALVGAPVFIYLVRRQRRAGM
ncbi:iron complex transport system permease protein [Haloactinospora alba]|uniref:Iron complex transport system permease protein n=1 Tax=Haloactinospora alba TaxID=405555 RepID=A0A543NEA1_9ACTN|nr:iron ABC transporter permease [Haloactinospora alba]TQN30174.1 iron complex transport system permease protein [Haloactinospora alba]